MSTPSTTTTGSTIAQAYQYLSQDRRRRPAGPRRGSRRFGRSWLGVSAVTVVIAAPPVSLDKQVLGDPVGCTSSRVYEVLVANTVRASGWPEKGHPDGYPVQRLKSGTTSVRYFSATSSSAAFGSPPCTRTSVAMVSSGPKNWPPSGIHGRATAASTTGLKAEMIGLFWTSGSAYADVRVGSRPSSSARKACDSAELMNLMKAIAASTFSCG